MCALQNARLLMMDEATASVDMETDESLQQMVKTQFRECTVLTIAHRLNTIMESDDVLVLAAGKVRSHVRPSTKSEGFRVASGALVSFQDVSGVRLVYGCIRAEALLRTTLRLKFGERDESGLGGRQVAEYDHPSLLLDAGGMFADLVGQTGKKNSEFLKSKAAKHSETYHANRVPRSKTFKE
jgi:ABC-type sugar transport system ATPase subunit